MNTARLSRRYPGVTPFEREQEHLFFGRDQEIADLLRLTALERLLVLFGKSGHGKSSLLNAGVLPKLPAAFRGKTCVSIAIRLGAYARGESLPPKEALLAELERACPPAPGAEFYENLPTGRTLWRAFKRRQPAGGAPVAFALFFDQFEEFFLYPADQQQQFRQEISELLYTEIPQAAFHEFDRLDEAAQDHLSQPLDVHAVFAIRSDRLHLLDSMRQELPDILRKRYELRGLRAEQAEAAMVRPAAADDPRFDTLPFAFQPAALQRIVDELASSGSAGEDAGQIESFQLQIVCQSIEDAVRARNRRGEREVTIAAAELPDFEKIFENYYAARIGSLADAEQERTARLLLEEELLYVDEAKGEARRLSMDGDALAANLHAKHGRALPPALLDTLVNAFLVRREQTARGTHYEISHDTLVSAILAAREERRRAEREAAERERLRQEAEERERQLAEEQRKRRRANLIATGGITLAGIALVALIVAARANKKAQAEKRNAEVALDSAQAAQSRAEAAQRKAEDARVQADTARAEADRQTDNARRSAAETVAALRQLGKTNAFIAGFLTSDANDEIYQLNYPAAAEKLQAAARLNQPSDSLRRAVLEVAFFYNEANKSRQSAAFLAEAGYRGAPEDRKGLRIFIKQKDPAWSDSLEARYFPRMVRVQGGSFKFGDKTDASVSDFLLAEAEATFWQFALFDFAMDRSHIRPTWGFAGDNPVVNVSWYDAVKYANWLSENRGLEPVYYNIDSMPDWTANGYRLPTETEWEYAARGGPQQQDFEYAGSNDLDEVAWRYYNSDKIHGVKRTNAGKLKKPVSEHVKIYDLSGNVWEWCWDWHDSDYPAAPDKDYKGPPGGSSRALRGGSWYVDYNGYFRVGYRYYSIPEGWIDDIGFRLSQDSK